MSNLRVLWGKMKRRLRRHVVTALRETPVYPLIYSAWWRTFFFPSHNGANHAYMAAVPNPGAGIGHQMANWISGLWWAKKFGLAHAHVPFTPGRWDDFLGLGEGQVQVDGLLKNGFRLVRLPLFDEESATELASIRRMIDAHGPGKWVFLLEQDQGYREQFGVCDELQKRFYGASARKEEKLRYSEEHFNIAIHVRRGDICAGQTNGNSNLAMRWQGNEYFLKVLEAAIANVPFGRPVRVYLFSQGLADQYREFERLCEVEFCLDMGAEDSFLHMVHADMLITSRSSFSYKPALLSKGIKVCPRNFWHAYPDSPDWILADDEGRFEEAMLQRLKQSTRRLHEQG